MREPCKISIPVSVLIVAGCSSSGSTATAPDAAGGSDAPGSADGAAIEDGGEEGGEGGAVFGDGGSATNVRGQRYCELLLAQLTGGNVDVDVYNTFGLDDCPQAQWSAIDTTALAQQLGVTEVLANGPRYWMIDSFVSATLVDPTVRNLGGIEMREAATISMPYSPSATLGTPYVTHQINRNTVVSFSAGRSVYELTDPQGKIYDMQSYSTQVLATQTEADLASLGSTLTLPTGWSFRTRVLTEDLVVTAVGGVGIVVQDNFDNTYQQSQQ